MTIMLDHFPEPRPAHGGLAAEGAANLLGRPEMDALEVLTREAVQNSWDACKEGTPRVQVEIALRELDAGHRRVLADDFFAVLPPGGLFRQGDTELVELSAALRERDLLLLSFTDRGTTGLGGPIRADQPAREGQSTNFVDLVFNIGQPPDKELGGGTYGFGKTIAYLVSRCRTVIIHTATESAGSVEQRLIVQSIGHQYTHNGHNFTGRHWWGQLTNGVVLPVVGSAAESLATGIGLPRFGRGETGTTIAVLQPSLGGRSAEQAVAFIATSLAWNFWPKMIAFEGEPAMSFEVAFGDKRVDVPDPRATPPLDAYAQALDAIRDCESGRKSPSEFELYKVLKGVASERPRQHLGWIAIRAVIGQARPPLDEGTDEEGSPTTAAAFTGRAHHIALMRRAELIVSYEPGPELDSSVLEWIGVFKAAEPVDQAFAAAEPPTHDAWKPNLVANARYKSFVNVALRRIKDAVNGAFRVSPAPPDDDTERSAVVIAEALGQLINSAPGTGSGRPADRPGRIRSSRIRSSPKLEIGPNRMLLREGHAILEVPFKVEPASGARSSVVRAGAAVASGDSGGREAEPPLGAATAVVLGFQTGDERVTGYELTVDAADRRTWTVTVETAEDAATVLDLQAVSVSEAAP
jgi:hypothetical protein